MKMSRVGRGEVWRAVREGGLKSVIRDLATRDPAIRRAGDLATRDP